MKDASKYRCFDISAKYSYISWISGRKREKELHVWLWYRLFAATLWGINNYVIKWDLLKESVAMVTNYMIMFNLGSKL